MHVGSYTTILLLAILEHHRMWLVQEHEVASISAQQDLDEHITRASALEQKAAQFEACWLQAGKVCYDMHCECVLCFNN